MHQDLLCHQCHEQESGYLLFFSKYYHDVKRSRFSHPMLICYECAVRFSSDDRMFENKPIIKSFSELEAMPMKKLMWYCSDKGKEGNDLSSKIWRTKILRIRKVMEGRTLKWTKQTPMPF